MIAKQGSLESSNTNLLRKLSDRGIYIVEQSCINPIDNIWSLSISDNSCSLLTASGVAQSKELALHFAINSFIGKLNTVYFWSNSYIGEDFLNKGYLRSPDEKWFTPKSNKAWPDEILNAELHDFFNPTKQLHANCLIDISASKNKLDICCLPFININTNESVYFPNNLIKNLYANNGIATADSANEAKLLALLEILERFVQTKVIAEGISLPSVPDNILKQYPDSQRTLTHLRELGFEISIKDASLNGKYPVLVALLINPKQQGVYLSFKAHTHFENALQGCINQLFTDRGLNQFDIFPAMAFDMDEVASPQNLAKHFTDSNGIVSWKSLKDMPDYEYTDWNNTYSNTDTINAFNLLCEIIYKEDREIYISEYNDFDMHSCQMIIPRISEIYPLDTLLWENSNAGIAVRDQIVKKNKTLDECEKLIEALEELNLEDEYLVSTLIALPTDKNCIFEDLCIAELILLLALKTQDNERIQESCEWLLDYKKINPHRLKTYECINTVLQLENMTDYGKTLEKLYTHETLKDALALLDGVDVFPLESNWKVHQSLLTAYANFTQHNH